MPPCIFLYGNVFIYTFLKEILNNHTNKTNNNNSTNTNKTNNNNSTNTNKANNNNSTNTNKTDNYFSPQLIEQKKTMTYYGVGNPDLGLRQA